MKFLRAQWFSIAMLTVFALAWLAPGVVRAINPDNLVRNAAIVLIFLVSGLSLRTEESIRAAGAWRLHAMIQGFSFVFMPAVCWVGVNTLGRGLPEGLIVGFYLLAAVPTTVTTCVVFTQLAGGNFAGALFNSVLGNLLGVFISPWLIMLMTGTSGVDVDLDPWGTLVTLCWIVLLPFAVGQAFHGPVLRRWKSFKKVASHINRWCVLLIIYIAFGDVFGREAADVAWRSVAAPLALLVPGHFLMLWVAGLASRWAGFERPDRLAVIFCAPQKTLAMGIPMASAVLAAQPELLGLASLPLLVYHPVQLLVGGLLQERYRQQSETLMEATK